jgi:hypothetical protein
VRHLLLLILTSLSLLAVQPLPNGATVSWDQPIGPGFSNWSYFVWRTLPPATNWLFLGQVNTRTYFTSNLVVEGTMYGVSGNFESNNIVRATDIGVAGWPPSFSATAGTVKLTPTGGVRVATNQWTKVSYDMKMFTEYLRFSTPTNGVVVVEHRVSSNRPYLFMLYLSPTNPPPLGAALK